MSEKPSKQGSEATQWPKGKSGNPGGLTAEQRAFHDLMKADLSSEPMRLAWKAGYLQCLQEANPLILKDYADRTMGKPKERVEVSQDPENPSPYMGLTLVELQAVARAQLQKEGEK